MTTEASMPALEAVPEVSGLVGKLDIELHFTADGAVAGSMPVTGNTQIHGRLHGGASLALAETLASIAAGFHAETIGRIAVGTDVHATHHRGVKDGTVHGVARAVHLGGTLTSHEVVITDDADRRICTALITNALIRPEAPPRPLP